MEINLEEYYQLIMKYYYSEPGKYTPENDFDITAEEMILITEVLRWHRIYWGKPDKLIDTDDFDQYSYFNAYYLEWIASLNRELVQSQNVDWEMVLSDKRGKTTEIFYNENYGVESPWWTSDKYADMYQRHREESKIYYYRLWKEEEHRKAENKAAQLIRRARKKAEKDYKNGK